MNNVKVFGKYLDQPKLISNFTRCVTPALALSAGGIVLHDALKTPEKKRKKRVIQNGLTMFGAVASSLAAPKVTAKFFKTVPKLSDNKLSSQIDEFVKNKHLDANIVEILDKAKSKVLSIREVSALTKNFKSKEEQIFLNKLIPEPENINSKEIFSEIGRLSVFGLIPVLGGITGGIVGDMLVSDDYKDKIPNKIKEGAYQYLANIFLCNIGAGMALGIMEKFNVKSKSVRAAGMIAGIIATGVVGGSFIANLIGRKVINKCFRTHSVEDERKPEALDICLHADDIATVAVMSGLRWIEPSLPALYSISGYRAGSGYRGTSSKGKHSAS